MCVAFIKQCRVFAAVMTKWKDFLEKSKGCMQVPSNKYSSICGRVVSYMIPCVSGFNSWSWSGCV